MHKTAPVESPGALYKLFSFLIKPFADTGAKYVCCNGDTKCDECVHSRTSFLYEICLTMILYQKKLALCKNALFQYIVIKLP